MRSNKSQFFDVALHDFFLEESWLVICSRSFRYTSCTVYNRHIPQLLLWLLACFFIDGSTKTLKRAKVLWSFPFKRFFIFDIFILQRLRNAVTFGTNTKQQCTEGRSSYHSQHRKTLAFLNEKQQKSPAMAMEARQPNPPVAGELSDSVWQSIPFEAERDERNFRKANKVEAATAERNLEGKTRRKTQT